MGANNHRGRREGTYLQLVSAYKGNNIVGELPDSLVPLWCDDYTASNPLAELVQVDIAEPTGPPFSHLFALTPQRNVVAWGVPAFVTHKRDATCMRGHPLGRDNRYHRGHLMSHATGGGTDINLIPQLGSLRVRLESVTQRHSVPQARARRRDISLTLAM